MAIIPVKQTLSVTFARANEANLAIANSAKGGQEDSLTEVIAPVSRASGKITATQGNTAVSGVGTDFENDFSVGDYLFYYNIFTATPALLGKIASIQNASSMTLTAGGSSTTINAPGAYCGFANVVLGASEDILMRVQTNYESPFIYLPNWNQWLSPQDFGAYNNEATNNLETFSAIGNPSTPASPSNIPYTISPVFGWELNPATQTYFPAETDFPNFAFAVLSPYGSTSDNLSPNTLFKLFASASFDANAIKAGVNYKRSDLKLAGYFI